MLPVKVGRSSVERDAGEKMVFQKMIHPSPTSQIKLGQQKMGLHQRNLQNMFFSIVLL